jgi:hypothetical protein
MTVKKLKKQLKETQQELYDLHLAEPSEVYYNKKRSELEYAIAALENEIDLEKTMTPLKYMLYGFIIVTMGLLTWAYAVSN